VVEAVPQTKKEKWTETCNLSVAEQRSMVAIEADLGWLGFQQLNLDSSAVPSCFEMPIGRGENSQTIWSGVRRRDTHPLIIFIRFHNEIRL